jgi:2-iminobutanoate/2-iminopropanoate deaminase
MSDRRIVSTPSAPAAIGAYSQAVIAGGFVHCSGQIALDPATGELVGADVSAETEQVMKNLTAVLAAAGSSFEHVCKCNVYLLDMVDFAAMNAVYARYVGQYAPPARAAVAVSQLPRGARVEIDCIALA